MPTLITAISCDILITTLCDRLGWVSTNAAHRAAALKLLQDSETWISQQGSFKYLEREQTLTLTGGTNLIAIPPWVDFAKTMSLGTPDGNGKVKIVPSDQFREDKAFTYGAWNLTGFGRICHIALASDGVTRNFIFDQTPTVNQTYPFSAQQLPNVLADNNSTFSALPVGYETSILLRRAEFQGKREIGAIISQGEFQDFQTEMQAWMDQQRTSRESAKPDSEVIKRKASEIMAEGNGVSPGRM